MCVFLCTTLTQIDAILIPGGREKVFPSVCMCLFGRLKTLSVHNQSNSQSDRNDQFRRTTPKRPSVTVVTVRKKGVACDGRPTISVYQHALGMGCFRRSMAVEGPASAADSVVELQVFSIREVHESSRVVICCFVVSTDKLLND